MIDIGEIATNLVHQGEDLWIARDESEISYPKGGNDRCFSVEEGSFWFAHRNRCIVEVMRLFPPAGTLFDVGGGNGYVASGISEAGWETVVVEPGRAGAANAHARGLRPVVCATLQDAGFQPGALPSVGIFDTLEHVEDDVGFLRSIAERMADDARLYITVPAYQWLWSVDDEIAGHHRRYTLASLRSALNAAGLDMEFGSYFFYLLPLPVALFRTLPSRRGARSAHAEGQIEQEHKAPSGTAGRILNLALDLEAGALARAWKIPFGGSCMAVARPRA